MMPVPPSYMLLPSIKWRERAISEASRTLKEMQRNAAAFKEHEEAESSGELDDVSRLDETMAEIELRLMADEQEWLERLVEAAESVQVETKTSSIIAEVRGYDPGTSVLFFTEYKATQSRLMSALIAEYGENSVAFINGDGEARDVVDSKGQPKTIRSKRTETADRFNRGDVRFLVSTEAAGVVQRQGGTTADCEPPQSLVNQPLDLVDRLLPRVRFVEQAELSILTGGEFPGNQVHVRNHPP
jgi:hypothetical protein